MHVIPIFFHSSFMNERISESNASKIKYVRVKSSDYCDCEIRKKCVDSFRGTCTLEWTMLWRITINSLHNEGTVFPHIVSAETILFWIWKSKGHSAYGQRSQYINVRKLFKGRNYMRKYGNQLIKLWFLQATEAPC